MKRVVAALLLVVTLLGMTACETADKPTYEERTIEECGFHIIERLGGKGYTNIYLVYDPDTGIEYLFLSGYHEDSICPYYNSDGTVAIYNGK